MLNSSLFLLNSAILSDNITNTTHWLAHVTPPSVDVSALPPEPHFHLHFPLPPPSPRSDTLARVSYNTSSSKFQYRTCSCEFQYRTCSWELRVETVAWDLTETYLSSLQSEQTISHMNTTITTKARDAVTVDKIFPAPTILLAGPRASPETHRQQHDVM